MQMCRMRQWRRQNFICYKDSIGAQSLEVILNAKTIRFQPAIAAHKILVMFISRISGKIKELKSILS